MKIEIDNNFLGYYVVIYIDKCDSVLSEISRWNIVFDREISKILCFNSVDEYQNLGVKYGGFLSNDGLFFYNKKDVNKFINSDEFISHAVMGKLKI